jgi:hypothetical protein
MSNLATILRSSRPRAAPQQIEVPPEPAVAGPMIEFVKQDGLTSFVFVRSKGKVHTLRMNRNEDGELLSATLLKE